MSYYKEILLIEGIILALLWMFNDYLASLITFIIVPILFATLVVSMIVEKISKSNIPHNYFHMMVGLTIIPIIFFMVFSAINNGLSWSNSK